MPGPRKHGYSQLIDLKFSASNGIHNTSKHGEFSVIGFSTFRNMTSQIYPSPERNESSQFDIYPLESIKIFFKISHFMNIFSGPKLYTPMHLCGFQRKQKIHMFNCLRCRI